MRWIIILKNMDKVEIAGTWLRAETNAIGARTTLRVKDGASYVAEFDGKIVAGWYEVPEEDRPGFRWIPLSEQAPEDGTWNLFTDGKRISLERYKQDAEDHFHPAGRYFGLTEAVAWMELPEQAWTLPEPYKEEQDEQGAG